MTQHIGGCIDVFPNSWHIYLHIYTHIGTYTHVIWVTYLWQLTKAAHRRLYWCSPILLSLPHDQTAIYTTVASKDCNLHMYMHIWMWDRESLACGRNSHIDDWQYMHRACVYVCIYVCVRERERERESLACGRNSHTDDWHYMHMYICVCVHMHVCVCDPCLWPNNPMHDCCRQ